MRALYLVIAAILVVAVFAVIYSFMGRSSGTTSRDLSQVIADGKAGNIERIVVKGDRLTITKTDGTKYTSRKEHGASIIDTLQNQGVKISLPDGIDVSVQKDSPASGAVGLIISFLPLIIFAGVLIFFGRHMFRRNQPPSA